MNSDFTEKKVLLVGLPEAGKSTFIAALWGTVTSDQIPQSLKLAAYNGDDTYLNKLYEYWSKAEEVPRTFITNEGLGVIALSDRKNAQTSFGKLIIPDLAGERFMSQWENRRISTEHSSHIQEVTSIIFFIHSKKINRGFLNNRTVSSIDDIFDKSETPVMESEGFVEKPFSPREVPTQTILVDILKTTLLLGKSINKIAVVISAWDLVAAANLLPLDWLRINLPLLSQYLQNNVDRFEYRVWGVSAQGHDFRIKDKKIREELLSVHPVKRVIVTNAEGSNHDITSPLRWLF